MFRKKKKKRPEISAPQNFQHRVHTSFDPKEGKFVGLPPQWQNILDTLRRPKPVVDPSRITRVQLQPMKTVVRGSSVPTEGYISGLLNDIQKLSVISSCPFARWARPDLPPLVSLPRVPVAFGMTVTPSAGLALCYLHRDVSKKRGEWCSWPQASKADRLLQIFKGSVHSDLGQPRGCMLHLHMDTCYSQLKLQTLESQRATGKDFAA